MRKVAIALAAAAFISVLLPLYGQVEDKPIHVGFSPAEVESMLFLYNQTPVKGSDVELVAPVGAKLRAGLKAARTQQDSTKSIMVPLLPAEVQVCLGIINASTFEAKYADLVLGMKRKLESYLQPPVPAGTAVDKGGKNK